MTRRYGNRVYRVGKNHSQPKDKTVKEYGESKCRLCGAWLSIYNPYDICTRHMEAGHAGQTRKAVIRYPDTEAYGVPSESIHNILTGRVCI